jgi:membrane protein implicated in regulation of membrane protease activity
VRRAYEPSGPSGTDALIGAIGVVTSPLHDNGYVRIGPEFWRARSMPGVEPAEVGAAVRVGAVDGFMLLVERVEDGQGS